MRNTGKFMYEDKSPINTARKAVDDDNNLGNNLRRIINEVRGQIKDDHGQINDEYRVSSISTQGFRKSSSPNHDFTHG
jgi:hypothetical protein